MNLRRPEVRPNPALASSLAGAVLWAVLAVPPIRQMLEATMTAQMLVQIPLLALAGWLAAAAIPRGVAAPMTRWNAGGIAGLLLASLASMPWMLPRMMDASVVDGWIAAAKYLCVPLLIGAPVALSWPLAGFVVRGMFLLELIATAFRLGWLYLAAPGRLCSNYLIGDQLRLGRYLLAVGVILCLAVTWRVMWGRVRVTRPGC